MKLDVGCGKNKNVDYVGIDLIKWEDVDYVVDIDSALLPFQDDTVDEIRCHHTLEHCKNIIHIMNEFHRVCKDGAEIDIIVPYGTTHQFVQDPTHKTPFNENTFRKYFCDPAYVASFSDYGIAGFFEEQAIFIKGKDINHLQLYVRMKVVK